MLLARIPLFLKSPRFWLAGPTALITAIALMLAMAIWFPVGRGNIDNIVLPLVLFPLIWAIFFFSAYLANRLTLVAAIFFLILIVNCLVLWLHLAD